MSKPKKKHNRAKNGPKPEVLQLNDSFEVAVKKALSRGRYGEHEDPVKDKQVKHK
jgi:hypothetical protein